MGTCRVSAYSNAIKEDITDKNTSRSRAHKRKEQPHKRLTQEISRENALRIRGANGEPLLQSKQKQQDTANHPKRDLLSSSPVEEISSKVDCHDQGRESTDVQYHAEIVDLQQFLFERHAFLRIATGKEEDVDWRKSTTYAEVDIESPSPGRV